MENPSEKKSRIPKKKKRINKEASSSTSSSNKRKRNKISQDHDVVESPDALKLSCEELKGMKELSSIDDAFRFSWAQIIHIIDYFLFGRCPTTEEYLNWDLYTKAFYLKMHSSCRNKPPFSYLTLKKKHEVHIGPGDTSSEKKRFIFRTKLMGPFKFGFYSEETSPDCIPYHLYLLVKEVVDIIKHLEWSTNTDDVLKLERVENKIRFFCNYFYSHLPVGWRYKRADAIKVVASYDTKRQPRYNMAGYTPINTFKGRFVGFEYDQNTRLTRLQMIAIMCIIHSRETPRIWELSSKEISFYCQICSCFGIDYHRLEAASEDDVCLMDVGIRP